MPRFFLSFVSSLSPPPRLERGAGASSLGGPPLGRAIFGAIFGRASPIPGRVGAGSFGRPRGVEVEVVPPCEERMMGRSVFLELEGRLLAAKRVPRLSAHLALAVHDPLH